MKTVISILLLVLPVILFAQNQKQIDSLLIELDSQKEDTLKVKTFHALFDAYMYKDADKCLEYATQELELSKKIDYKAGIGKGNLHIGMAYYFQGNIDSVRSRFKKASDVFHNIKDYFLIATVSRNLAIIEYENGNYDDALPLLNKTVDIYKNKLNDSIGVALAYETISKVHIFKGNFKIAMQYGIKSLQILEAKNNPTYLAQSLNNLGIIESYNSQYQESINHNLRALEIYEKYDEKWWSAQVHNDIGNNYYSLKEFDKAIYHLTKSIDLSRKVNAKYIECTSLSALGKVYLSLNKLDKAQSLLEKSIIVGEELELRNKKAETQNHLGELFSKKGLEQKAIAYYDEAAKIADTIGAKDNLKNIYYNRSLSYAKIGDYKKAFKDSEKLRVLNDSIYNKTKSQQIEELKTIYETEKKEAEIALQNEEIKTLNIQAKNDKLTKTLYASGMFSFITIAGLIYIGFRQRIKKNEIEREKQEAILKQEIEFKKKELASQTLHLVQKSTFIQELKENLEKIKKSPELFKIEFRRLVMLLKKESAEDKDWEVFKSYFSEVHNNFDNRLKALSQDITEKEIRLASFLRMNLSTKEIASMLNVLPESVLKSKYRLKKKLNLNKETDLNAFLNTM